eukprot:scaffold7052_cov254-Pinguiococcus_pyrenoidosus.AAC.131
MSVCCQAIEKLFFFCSLLGNQATRRSKQKLRPFLLFIPQSATEDPRSLFSRCMRRFASSRLFRRTLCVALCQQRCASMSTIDIGANLLDPMFQGHYHGSAKHPTDLYNVLQRAFDPSQRFPLSKVLVTAGSAQEAREAAALCAGDAGGKSMIFWGGASTTIG